MARSVVFHYIMHVDEPCAGICGGICWDLISRRHRAARHMMAQTGARAQH